MIVKDLLVLTQAVNEGVVNLLGEFLGVRAWTSKRTGC